MSLRILLLYAHPDVNESIANRVLIQSASHLEHVTVHDLYANYPDFFIDIDHEQQLVTDHEILVFQHPLYTYGCPALLKEWIDYVLAREFSGGVPLAGKYWRSVITTGDPQHAFHTGKEAEYPLADILRPFEMTAKKYRMRWLPPLVVYGARRLAAEELSAQAARYREWLQFPLNLRGQGG